MYKGIAWLKPLDELDGLAGFVVENTTTTGEACGLKSLQRTLRREDGRLERFIEPDFVGRRYRPNGWLSLAVIDNAADIGSVYSFRNCLTKCR